MKIKLQELNFIGKYFQPSILPKIKNLVQMQELEGPIVVDIDLSTNCNYRCPTCVNRELLGNKIIPAELLQKILSDLKTMRTLGIIFSGGGEPLTYPYMPVTLITSSELGLKIGLVTNGYFVDKFVDIIAEKVDWIRFSMDAAKNKTYNIFRPNNDKLAFNKVIDNMYKLAKIKKGKLGFSFLIQSIEKQGQIYSNLGEVVEAAKLANDNGCDYFELKPAVNDSHNLIPFSNETKMELCRIMEVLSGFESESFTIIYPTSIDYLLNNVSVIQHKSYTWCPVLELRTLITPYGVFPCPYKRGNSNYDSVQLTVAETLY